MNWLKKLYDKMLELSKRPEAIRWMSFFSFIEAIFFPIPPDIMLLPICISDRKKAFKAAAYCTLFSVLGAMLGYALGMFLYDEVAKPLLDFYQGEAAFIKIKGLYSEYGSLGILVAAISPIPFKVFTLSSGIFAFPFYNFIFFSIIGRGFRFFLEAVVARYSGEWITEFVENNFNLVTIVFSVLLVGGFVLLKLAF